MVVKLLKLKLLDRVTHLQERLPQVVHILDAAALAAEDAGQRAAIQLLQYHPPEAAPDPGLCLALPSLSHSPASAEPIIKNLLVPSIVHHENPVMARAGSKADMNCPNRQPEDPNQHVFKVWSVAIKRQCDGFARKCIHLLALLLRLFTASSTISAAPTPMKPGCAPAVHTWDHCSTGQNSGDKIYIFGKEEVREINMASNPEDHCCALLPPRALQ